jgi:hypothetical protein
MIDPVPFRLVNGVTTEGIYAFNHPKCNMGGDD